MNITKSVYRCIILIALTILLQPHQSVAKWIYARHNNWEILSERGEGQTQRLWQDLQYFQQATELCFPKLEQNLDHPMRMIIVTKGKTLDLLNHEDKRSDAPGGYYLSRPHGDTIVLFNDATSYAVPHEFMHRLTDRLDLPSWANEGVATLFESFKVKRNKIYIGGATTRVYSFLYGGKINWDSFFNNHPQKHGNGDQKTISQFYGLAWALAHYYFFGEGKMDRSKYLNLAAVSRMKRITEEDVLEQLGMNYTDLHKTIKKYLERGSYEYYRLQKDNFAVPEILEFKKSEDFVSKYILIQTMIDIGKQSDAAWKLEDWLASDPDQPGPYELKAQLKIETEQFSEAYNLAEKAEALGSTSPNPKIIMAGCKLIEFGARHYFLQPELDINSVNVVLKLIAPVLEENPCHQAALDIAVATWASAKPIPSESALNLLRHAVRNRPSDFVNWAVLCQCLIRADYPEEARNVLLKMRAHKDADKYVELMDYFASNLETPVP